MAEDLRGRIHSDDTLISGGAAWADHLAVHAFLQGWCAGLRLHLPAPFGGPPPRFEGGYGTSGGASNHYHDLFAGVRGVDGRQEILEAGTRGAELTYEPAGRGYAAMMRRNAKVAKDCTRVLAYTFNEGDVPADGGTRATWDMCAHAERLHVDLGRLAEAIRETAPASQPVSRLARFRGG
jgi:hypothetical protein